MATILMIIAPELFSEKELFITKEELEKAGHKTIISSDATRECSGSGGRLVTADLPLAEVQIEDYDAVVFVGGRGSKHYFTSEEAFRIAKETSRKNKILAAICLASTILANAGVLDGRLASVAKTEVKTIQSKGVKYNGPGITVDGNIITGSSPKYSKKFAQKIIEGLRNLN